MQRLDFFQLPRPVQDRFIGCARGEGQPAALLCADAETPRDLPIFVALATGGMLGLVILLRWGFGELGSSVALQPPAMIALYLAVLVVGLAGAFRVAQRLRETSVLPFRAGVYLFPSAVIDARRSQLRVFSLTTLVESAPKDRSFSLTFADGTAFVLPVRDPRQGEMIDAELRKGREALNEAIAAEDKKKIGQLDPLADIGMANPFAPKTSIAPRSSLIVRRTWELAVLVAVLLAPLFWWARNQLSDRSMYHHAERDRTVEEYRAYLASGGHNDRVKAVLLPRAELAEAVRKGSVDAVEKYVAEHPGITINGEVSSALRQAMLIELEAAKKEGTVSALVEFARRHPNHLVDDEWRDAVHGVYQAAWANYTKRSGVKDPTALGFMQQLFSFVEKSGPKVLIRFRRRSTRSMDVADRRVKKNHHYIGPESLPSQYFDDDHARPREATMAQAMIDRFASSFPPDVLSLEKGPPLTDPDAPLSPAGAPTMFIDHTVETSGALYPSTRPKGIFAGIGFGFEVNWLIPGVSRPYQMRTSVWRPPRPRAAKGAPDPVEGAVYEAMAQEAYSRFTRRYLTPFFPNAAAEQAASEAKE